jgi:serine/threonine-protein kinase
VIVDRRYRVRREIARGGMGVVYEAVHQVLGETVALKVLTRQARHQRGAAQRFEREALALARARHPGVVGVRDAGVCEFAGPYVVLDRLEGRTLDGLLAARSRLPLPSVLALAAELGASLTHAHRAGVVHRDVKPANVFITHTSRGERAILLDFGIAHVVGLDAGFNHRLTRAGEVLGTPEYIAPELLIDDGDPTPRSDVYSLAVLLYECLSGELPFTGNTMQLMSAHLIDKAPKALSQRCPELPSVIDAAIMRALSRDPLKRPATPSELASQLLASAGAAPALNLLSDPSSPEVGGASRRQFARAPYGSPVRLDLGDRVVDGRTEDISEGGALVLGATTPSEGHEVTVRIPLPTSGRVALLRATTKWVRTRRGTHALGVEFIDLTTEARADIARYVALMSPRS